MISGEELLVAASICIVQSLTQHNAQAIITLRPNVMPFDAGIQTPSNAKCKYKPTHREEEKIANSSAVGGCGRNPARLAVDSRPLISRFPPLIGVYSHFLSNLITRDHDRTRWRNLQTPRSPAFEKP